MKKDILTMSQKEEQRYHLLQMVIDGKTTLKETSRLMGVRRSYLGKVGLGPYIRGRDDS
jgi:hypothetical protein